MDVKVGHGCILGNGSLRVLGIEGWGMGVLGGVEAGHGGIEYKSLPLRMDTNIKVFP